MKKAILKDLKADGVAELWLGTAADDAAGQALFASTGGIRSADSTTLPAT